MKHSLFARIICIVLVLLMLFCCIACANDTPDVVDTTASQTQVDETTGDLVTTDKTDDNGYILDNLPDNLNYGGKTVNIIAWKDVEHEEFSVEKLNGEPVNDAIFNRNTAVETRLGVTLNYIRTQDGDSGNVGAWTSYIGSQLEAQAHEFDIMACYSLSTASCAVKNYCYNLLDDDCEYLDFSMPWWPERLITEASINDVLFFASGDISANALYMMYVCYVNNNILKEKGLENPQNEVIDGKWTYDMFISMCTGVYENLNGNDSKDIGDRFGYMTSGIHVDPWFYGSGALIVEKQGDKLITSPTFYGANEKVLTTIDKLTNFLFNTQDGISTPNVSHQAQFAEGHLLFAMDRARVAETKFQVDETLDYTIIPCPKYDEEQATYVTVMGNPFTLYSLPTDCTDLSMCSAVMECLASEGYRKITPALFNVAMKVKYSKDEISGVMYDIIRENISFDLGRIFSASLIGQTLFRTQVNSNVGTWASASKANADRLTKLLPIIQKVFDNWDK